MWRGLPREAEQTLFLVDNVKRPRNTETWHGAWERLSDKVEAMLRRSFARTSLPPGLEAEDLFCSVLAKMVQDLPGLEVRGREHHCHLEAAPLREVTEWTGAYRRFWEDRLDALASLLRARPGARGRRT